MNSIHPRPSCFACAAQTTAGRLPWMSMHAVLCTFSKVLSRSVCIFADCFVLLPVRSVERGDVKPASTRPSPGLVQMSGNAWKLRSKGFQGRLNAPMLRSWRQVCLKGLGSSGVRALMAFVCLYQFFVSGRLTTQHFMCQCHAFSRSIRR